MTKKDYITIANALKPYWEEWKINHCEDSRHIILDIINAISKEIKKDNPTYDPIKFLDYLRGYKKQEANC
jgi:hypothetical protein